jgi:hypothetical protein
MRRYAVSRQDYLHHFQRQSRDRQFVLGRSEWEGRQILEAPRHTR